MNTTITRNQVANKTPRKWFLERISRFKPIVFFKKRLLLTIFTGLFILSTLLGLWNVKKFSLYNLDGSILEDKISQLVIEYLEKNIKGENFFLIYSGKLSEELIRNISYVRQTSISKILPNRINIVLELYEPRIVSFTEGQKCSLLSIEGVLLEDLCADNESKNICCKEQSKKSNQIFLESDEVNLSDIEMGKKSLLVMNSISKIVYIIESFGPRVKEVYIKEGVIDVLDENSRLYRFSITDDILVQLSRLFVTMGKVRQDTIQYSIIDVRFERPVLKN